MIESNSWTGKITLLIFKDLKKRGGGKLGQGLDALKKGGVRTPLQTMKNGGEKLILNCHFDVKKKWLKV